MPKTPRASATMPTPPTGPILPKLGEVLTLRRRFLRSVSLERDARGGTGLDGYIPTPSAQAAIAG
jgi:hypothetical protein